MKVLVLFAHPALERSRINRVLIRAVQNVPGVTFNDLYEAYPDLNVDVEREQELLLAHDAIVFQHPFYWYSVPAILKEWQDLVLEHNWAYGQHGHHLDGKITFNALTTGGPEHAYRPGGSNQFTIRQLLAPWEATARLCRMRYLAPFVVHGALKMAPEQAEVHAREYAQVLEALVADRLDFEHAAGALRLNEHLPTVLQMASAPSPQDERPEGR